jgi:hypothetical protein
MDAGAQATGRAHCTSGLTVITVRLRHTSFIMSAEQVANAFVQHYYQTFDSNVQNLAGLFVSEPGIVCGVEGTVRKGALRKVM